MSQSWAGGSTRHQRRIRAFIIQRDTERGYGCRAHEEHTHGGNWCTRGGATPHTCTHQPQQAHHTHGYANTGDDPAYQVSCCQACNLAIGDPTTANDPTPRPATQW